MASFVVVPSGVIPGANNSLYFLMFSSRGAPKAQQNAIECRRPGADRRERAHVSGGAPTGRLRVSARSPRPRRVLGDPPPPVDILLLFQRFGHTPEQEHQELQGIIPLAGRSVENAPREPPKMMVCVPPSMGAPEVLREHWF